MFESVDNSREVEEHQRLVALVKRMPVAERATRRLGRGPQRVTTKTLSADEAASRIQDAAPARFALDLPSGGSPSAEAIERAMYLEKLEDHVGSDPGLLLTQRAERTEANGQATSELYRTAEDRWEFVVTRSETVPKLVAASCGEERDGQAKSLLIGYLSDRIGDPARKGELLDALQALSNIQDDRYATRFWVTFELFKKVGTWNGDSEVSSAFFKVLSRDTDVLTQYLDGSFYDWSDYHPTCREPIRQLYRGADAAFLS